MSINNLVVVSDLHCGCRVGLCPPRVRLDGGGCYESGVTQRQLWIWWDLFWNEWVPRVTRGEEYAILINGDALDGKHHNSKSQISDNFADQENIAAEVISPLMDKCKGRLYMVRGTEAHVGASAENEERLGRRVGAVERDGTFTQYEYWLRVGQGLVHATHHIGTTGRAAYETSALMAEITEMCVESAKWQEAPPDVLVRSHRHRHIKVSIPTINTYGIVFTTPGWQGKTPFVHKIPGGRVTKPQFGGAVIRQGDEELYTRHCTFTPKQRKPEVIS